MPYSSGVTGRGEQEPRQPFSTNRPRYSSGKPGGIFQYVDNGDSSSGSGSKGRGSGVKGRGSFLPGLFSGNIGGRSGAQRDIEEQNQPQPPVVEETPADPAPESTSEPGEVRVTPDGVVQQGRTIGPTRAQLVDFMGGEFENPFASNNLEVGASDPGTIEMIDGKKLDTPMSIDEYNAANPNDNPEPNAFDRSAARRAFLDADTSMGGKKAMDAQLGLVYASGQYWARNPNAGQEGEPELLAIDGSQPGGETRDAIRQYKAGEISAENFFNNYVRKTQEEIAEADTEIDEEDLPA